MMRSLDNKIEKLLEERNAHVREQVRLATALIALGHSVEFIAKKVRLDVHVVRCLRFSYLERIGNEIEDVDL